MSTDKERTYDVLQRVFEHASGMVDNPARWIAAGVDVMAALSRLATHTYPDRGGHSINRLMGVDLVQIPDLEARRRWIVYDADWNEIARGEIDAAQ